MKSRLNNLLTTVFGALILIGCAVLVFRGSATLTEASGFATIGIALILSKDREFAKTFLPFLIRNTSESSSTNPCPTCGQQTSPTDEKPL